MPKRPLSHSQRHTAARKKVDDRAYDKGRGSSAQRGYDRRWQKMRAAQLAGEPLCRLCKAEGRIVAATVADHVIAHKGDPELFDDPDNLQSLCATCHNRKTAREDGRWGGRVKSLTLSK